MKKYIAIALLALSVPATQGFTLFGSSNTNPVSVQELIDQGKAIVKNGVLNLSGMNITSLDGLQRIQKPALVEKIDLSHNQIAQLDENYFENFKNVTSLNLSHNQITQIIDDHFEDNKMLQTLNLSYNKIKKLSSDAFNDLHNLINLNLSHNDLTQLASNLFHDTKANIKVKLSGNPVYNKLNDLKAKMPKISFTK